MFRNTFPFGKGNKTIKQQYIYLQLLRYTKTEATFNIFQREISSDLFDIKSIRKAG